MDGEFELIAKLTAELNSRSDRLRLGVGDDASITIPNGVTATSIDALIDGVHFRRGVVPARMIGHKALASALSDLAAMGAEPGEAYVALAVPPDFSEEECLELYGGLRALAERTGTALAGGDVSSSATLSITVTVVGHAASERELVRRSGAHSGDVVAVTGELGGAAAGLLLLERSELGTGLSAAQAQALLARQREPVPRLSEGRALAGVGARAMIDISDGLGADAAHLARSGGVELRIELDRLPVQEGVGAVAEAAGQDGLDLAAAGGEDYELLICLPAPRLADATTALAAIGTELTEIGMVRAGQDAVLLDREGRRHRPAGFDHLRR